MTEAYSIQFADESDLDSWMQMIAIVRDNFPGIDTDELLEGYKRTVMKNIRRQTAICAKAAGEVVGILLFSYNARCLSCMGVHPEHRRQGLAETMVGYMLGLFPLETEISVTTFRENDPKGKAPRGLYRKMGFVEAELLEEFNYPHQRFVLRRSRAAAPEPTLKE